MNEYVFHLEGLPVINIYIACVNILLTISMYIIPNIWLRFSSNQVLWFFIILDIILALVGYSFLIERIPTSVNENDKRRK